jgi:hypothetical protein
MREGTLLRRLYGLILWLMPAEYRRPSAIKTSRADPLRALRAD